ncbi:MAG TPA: ATP-binding protein [Burkholderiales bacterium]|nr:ATP-binding protein [Burkholderiales bacterium]
MRSSAPQSDSEAGGSILHIPQLNRTRAILRALLSLAILLPCVFVLWYAWNSYQEMREEVEHEVERVVGVAEEHAVKVLEINEQINARVVALLDDRSDPSIKRNSEKYYALLKQIGAGMPQIQSINIFGADGMRLVSSRFQSNPAVSIADREDFYYHMRLADARPFVSPLFIGRSSNEAIFNMSVGRRDETGRFLGVVNTSLDPRYFRSYYKQILADQPGLTLTLLHANGTPILGFPDNEAVIASSEKQMKQRVAEGERRGSMNFVSELDGKERFYSFRRVGEYPLYLAAGATTQVWRQAWHQHVGEVMAFTFVPSFALWVLLVVTLRRLKREEEGWDQWRAEVTQRQAMELAYKKARRLEALGQLTGGVAHDFNNLLMVVSTSTMLLRRRFEGNPDTEQPLGALERSIEAGKRLTRQLLAFSRKQPLRPEVVDVAEHMRGFIDLVRTSIGGRIQLALEVDPDVKAIYADTAEFELALLNLALNARDAMQDGGCLTIRVRNLPASAKGGLSQDAVSIGFEDTGHGISSDNLERIFEPFFTTKAAGHGTGLGLAQVRGFCEEAGGMVRVRSMVGKGTTVMMLLPATEAAAVPSVERRQPVFPTASGRVLLVEDNPEVAAATRVLLEQLGYDVELCMSAEEGIALLHGERDWRILISDVLLPKGMSGIALAQALRDSHPDLPILLITGYTAQLEQAKVAGLKVLGKPFDVNSLRKAIDEVTRPRTENLKA